MDTLVEHGDDGALPDAGLHGDLYLHKAGVKAHAVVIDKVAVGSAGVGEAAVLIHAHKVVGADEVPAVDLGEGKERFAVQLVFAVGAGGDIHRAGAHAVVHLVELSVGLVLNAVILLRHGIAEDVAFAVCRNGQLHGARLGHAVAELDRVLEAVVLRKFLVFLPLLGGGVGAAAANDLEGGKVDVGAVLALHPLVDHEAGGKQDVKPVIADGTDKFRVQETEEGQHDRVSAGQEIIDHARHAQRRAEVEAGGNADPFV